MRNATCSLRIPQPMHASLMDHLFPGDRDEHGAVVLAGVSWSSSGIRLLARELHLARDGVDYVPGQRGYRQLQPDFVAELVDRCAEERLVYLAVHNHPGSGAARFSRDDRASHERGYPALLDINEMPVGALVFTENAVAGSIWMRHGRQLELDRTVVVGSNLFTLSPEPRRFHAKAGDRFDRQIRLYKEEGQVRLSELKVGVIGVGGVGSMLVEQLSRLGVGELVIVDPDVVEKSNLPRIVDSAEADIGIPKVDVAARVARRAFPDITILPLSEDITNFEAASAVKDADILFLAADNFQARNVFNALCYQYLIPGFQVGSKARSDVSGDTISELYSVVRPVLPYQAGGCLKCAGMIPPGRLSDEALKSEERRRQRYIDSDDGDESAPSVMPLNGIGASMAVQMALLMVQGMYSPNYQLRSQIVQTLEWDQETVSPEIAQSGCRDCGSSEMSRRARGDLATLPCKQPRS